MTRITVAVLLLVSTAQAKRLECGVNEHKSGEHCCRAGEEWVPAKRRCYCFDAQICGEKHVEKTKKVDKAELGIQIAGAVLGVVATNLDFEGTVAQMRGVEDWAKPAFAQDLAKSGKRFNCWQISRLMRTAQYEGYRVEIGAILYPIATDPGNWVDVVSAAGAEWARGELRERIGKQ
jgi:hypothetical protein